MQKGFLKNMRLINFIMFYQYFDSLESKLISEYNDLNSFSIDKLSIDQLRRLYDIKLKLHFLRQIYRGLSDFIIDL